MVQFDGRLRQCHRYRAVERPHHPFARRYEHHHGESLQRIRRLCLARRHGSAPVGPVRPSAYFLSTLSTALANSRNSSCAVEFGAYSETVSPLATASATTIRSEERRVGKECRS